MGDLEKMAREIADAFGEHFGERNDKCGRCFSIVLPYLRSVRNAALEEAAKEVCLGCKLGLHLEGEWHYMDADMGKAYGICNAQKIRSLKDSSNG
jgi:hypothetical protein